MLNTLLYQLLREVRKFFVELKLCQIQSNIHVHVHVHRLNVQGQVIFVRSGGRVHSNFTHGLGLNRDYSENFSHAKIRKFACTCRQDSLSQLERVPADSPFLFPFLFLLLPPPFAPPVRGARVGRPARPRRWRSSPRVRRRSSPRARPGMATTPAWQGEEDTRQ